MNPGDHIYKEGDIVHMSNRKLGIAAMLLAAVSAAGCGGNNGSPDNPTAEKAEGKAFNYEQSATLTFYNNIGVPDSYFTDYIEPHVKKKFPNVTLTYISSSVKENTMENFVTAGTVPDIILTTDSSLIRYMDLGVMQNLDPVAKTNGIDLNVFRDDMIQTLRGYSDKGELYVLPWTFGTYALFYNKDIFDKFGAAYPKDGMTWDSPELKAIVEKLSRTDGGVPYRGLEINMGGLIGQNQLSLPLVNAQTDKAAVNTDEWKKLIETYKAFYQISGNQKPDSATFDGAKAFIEERSAALWVGNAVYPRLIDLEKKGDGFNWDIVSVPTFKQAPNTTIQYGGALYGISSMGGNKDLAMHIISMLTSAEVQTEGGRLLRYPTLKAVDVKEAFGKGESFLDQKNMKSLHLTKIASSPKPTKYDSIARSVLSGKVNEILKGIKDTNTALREAEEEINKKIAEQKAAGK